MQLHCKIFAVNILNESLLTCTGGIYTQKQQKKKRQDIVKGGAVWCLWIVSIFTATAFPVVGVLRMRHTQFATNWNCLVFTNCYNQWLLLLHILAVAVRVVSFLVDIVFLFIVRIYTLVLYCPLRGFIVGCIMTLVCCPCQASVLFHFVPTPVFHFI